MSRHTKHNHADGIPEQHSGTVYGDLKIMLSPRTGKANGHISTVVEGSKRIDWVREYACENQMTPSKAIRLLVNEAIDRRLKNRQK